jgi:hypothetical protein
MLSIASGKMLSNKLFTRDLLISRVEIGLVVRAAWLVGLFRNPTRFK